MNGLGIIDTDLCMWAGTLTAADMEVAAYSLGHPTIKAKPAPVEWAVPTGLAGLVCSINAWVNGNPVLAGALVAAGYLMLSQRKARRK